jgi:predicted dienelactone hydrolase
MHISTRACSGRGIQLTIHSNNSGADVFAAAAAAASGCSLQLGYLPYLLDYLQHHPSTKGRLDLQRIGTAGHSRGSKLAALHLAGILHVPGGHSCVS